MALNISNNINIVKEPLLKHPQVDSWALTSPVIAPALCAAYLLFVLKIGPRFMENRKPYSLRKIIIVYNGLQVIYSFLMCFYLTGFRFDYYYYFVTNGCHPQKTLDMTLNINIGGWFYLFAKLTEFVDTICFILRKKMNQVTVLHVYHHSSTAFFTWAYLKYIPGEQGVILGFHNSFVHIFMYAYYFLSALGPEYQKYLWWKRYITIIQLAQFALNLIYLFSMLMMDCDGPKILTILFTLNTMLFFVLFTKFYIQSYLKNKKTK